MAQNLKTKDAHVPSEFMKVADRLWTYRNHRIRLHLTMDPFSDYYLVLEGMVKFDTAQLAKEWIDKKLDEGDPDIKTIAERMAEELEDYFTEQRFAFYGQAETLTRRIDNLEKALTRVCIKIVENTSVTEDDIMDAIKG